MLTSDEKMMVAESVALFAKSLLLRQEDERGVHEELDYFFNFFCDALTLAKRDGRKEALMTTTN